MRLAKLGSGAAGHGQVAENRREHIDYVIGRTYIAGAGLERGHPHFFVGNAVGADDGQLRKVPVKTFHVGEEPVLEVENHGFGMVSGDGVPQFLVGSGYMHREVRAESAGQRAGNFWVFLQNNDSFEPYIPRSSTANVCTLQSNVAG